MRFLSGFLLGSSLTVVTLAVVFAMTTVSYRSTLFPGQHVAIHALPVERVQPAPVSHALDFSRLVRQ